MAPSQPLLRAARDLVYVLPPNFVGNVVVHIFRGGVTSVAINQTLHPATQERIVVEGEPDKTR